MAGPAATGRLVPVSGGTGHAAPQTGGAGAAEKPHRLDKLRYPRKRGQSPSLHGEADESVA
ncbi:hypothetical protein Ssi02_17460 [Sinosporangium siamense]|uniref:Uncharacterized protein n=1 Tax=Sinosporangium siamense TaxID=1367973 RepID=A0A919V420_9ACTN|nr:hypothetical protein Ssi02_17460 [Sinosporangium siamense]